MKHALRGSLAGWHLRAGSVTGDGLGARDLQSRGTGAGKHFSSPVATLRQSSFCDLYSFVPRLVPPPDPTFKRNPAPVPYSDHLDDNFDGLDFEPLCRMACALLSAPAAIILLDETSYRWFHAADEAYRSLAASWPRETPGVVSIAGLPFGPQGRGILLILDRTTRNLSVSEQAALLDLADIAEQLLTLHVENKTLARRRAFFEMLAESSSETIVRGDLNGVRLYVSPSIRTLLGYEPEELIGKKALDITHPDDLGPLREMITRVFSGEIETGLCELRQRHKNGSWVWMEASQRLTYDSVTGAPDGYVVSVRGIERRKAYEAELERLAGHDELTGLPNRALFRKQLGARLLAGQPFSLLYLDLDDFKAVNDQLGHPMGDRVLQEVALRFRAILGAHGIVGRIGGDEFNALVDLPPDQIAALCESLIAAAAQPIALSDAEIRIGMSIGVITVSETQESVDMLLMRADHALYQAKRSGKNRYCLGG